MREKGSHGPVAEEEFWGDKDQGLAATTTGSQPFQVSPQIGLSSLVHDWIYCLATLGWGSLMTVLPS